MDIYKIYGYPANIKPKKDTMKIITLVNIRMCFHKRVAVKFSFLFAHSKIKFRNSNQLSV